VKKSCKLVERRERSGLDLKKRRKKEKVERGAFANDQRKK
jgi:hypothetical protein